MTSCLSSSELERGDVLLVTAQPKNKLATLILALDGAAGGFSHCGVALDGRRILSARVNLREMFWPVRWPLDLDLGGLQDDPFSHFWDDGQRIHRITVDPVERAAVARRLDHYRELPGGFSLPKIVAIAATLHALCPLNTEPTVEGRAIITRRAIALARAWRYDGDFFCAEFVATLYPWRFRVEDLRPPATRLDAVVPQAALVFLGLVAFVLTRAVSEDRARTVYEFLDAVREHDPAFLSGDRARAEEQLRRLGAQLGDPPPRPPQDDERPVDDATVIPPGLVTPRMIAARHRGVGAPIRIDGQRPGSPGRERAVRGVHG